MSNDAYKHAQLILWASSLIVMAFLILLFVVGCSINIPKDITVHCDNCGEGTDPAKPPPTAVVSWKGVQNALSGNCISCHNATNQSGGYNFTTYEGVMAAVVAGKPDSSKLCTETQNGNMPPAPKSIPKSTSDDFCKWIEQGAKET